MTDPWADDGGKGAVVSRQMGRDWTTTTVRGPEAAAADVLYNRLALAQTAERQFPHHTETGQQRQHRAQFLVCEPLELAGEPQLYRLAQFVEAHQHPAQIIELDDPFLEPLEEQRRGRP